MRGSRRGLCGWTRARVERAAAGALTLAASALLLAAAQHLAAQHLALPAQAAPAPAGARPDPAAAPPANVATSAGTIAAPATDPWTLPPAAAPVASYTLRVRLDTAAHTLEGSGTLQWRNTSAVAQRELIFHLYLNAFASRDTVFLRSEAGGGFRGSGVPAAFGSITVKRLHVNAWNTDLWPAAERHAPGDPDDATDIRVPLPQPVAPGETLTLQLQWSAELPGLTHRTGFEGGFHMVAQWFPKLARLEPDGRWARFPFHRFGEFYADFGDYDVTIDAPQGAVIGASGEAVSPGEADPPAPGDVRHRYRVRRVHDFAFVAWDGFEELRDRHRGVALRSLFPAGSADLGRVELDYAKRGLDHFGARYGAYPYPTLTIVHPPDDALDAGGMEYPTLITTGGQWLLHALGTRFIENVTVHELGHQWFYGLLASNEHKWAFLDEGVNTYAQHEAMEQWHPATSGASLPGLSISDWSVMRLLAAGSEHHGAVARPVTAYASGADYGNLVYRRTALLLETLARVYGRAPLQRALQQYTSDHRFAHPTPDALLAAIADQIGPEAAEIAHRGLFEQGWIDVRAEDPTRLPAEDGEHRGSVLLRSLGTLKFPVDIAFIDDTGTRHLHQAPPLDPASPHQRLHYRGPAPLAAVLLDPAHKLLIDQNLANNAARVDGPQSARRVAAHGAQLIHLVAAALAP